MERMKRIRPMGDALCALLLAAALCLGFTADALMRAGQVRDGVIRLHIRAASDGAADQAVKLRVRDAVLEKTAALLRRADSAPRAQETLRRALPELEETAEETLAASGFCYGAKVSLGRGYFDARAYGDVTLPAGEYTSLEIDLGGGTGHNWWCVLFPPLCAPGETADPLSFFNDSEADVLTPGGSVQVRLRIAELAKAAAKRLFGREDVKQEVRSEK